jgi:anthranilate synthase component 2
MCLGYQAIMEYFGAKLEQIEPVHGQPELIYHDKKTIYNGLPSPIKVGRYHSLAVKSIPLEFEVSGRTKSNIIMSVRHNTLPIEGIQYHPESVLSFYDQIDKRIFSNIVFKYFSNCF